MHLVAGLPGERSGRLLGTLLVIHSLTVATSAVSLSVDAPRFAAGGVGIVESAEYPLLAIVNCSGGQLEVSVDVLAVFGSGSFEVQFEENSNMPSQFFILPNDTGIAVLTGGEYTLVINCRNQSMVKTNRVDVSVLPPGMAAGISLPYFTDTPRYVNISASTPPGTVIAIYKAEFPPSSSEQPATQQYVVHNDFLSAPFQLNSSSGELTVDRSLQTEGTLSKYDIVVEADHNQEGQQVKAWTVTTIDIEPFKGPEPEETPTPTTETPTPTTETPTPTTGSGISGQANKIVLTIVAIVSVWAGNILLSSTHLYLV